MLTGYFAFTLRLLLLGMLPTIDCLLSTVSSLPTTPHCDRLRSSYCSRIGSVGFRSDTSHRRRLEVTVGCLLSTLSIASHRRLSPLYPLHCDRLRSSYCSRIGSVGFQSDTSHRRRLEALSPSSHEEVPTIRLSKVSRRHDVAVEYASTTRSIRLSKVLASRIL